MDVFKDNCGDCLSVEEWGGRVWLGETDEQGEGLSNGSEWIFSPEVARKLAKSLKRAARIAAGE